MKKLIMIAVVFLSTTSNQSFGQFFNVPKDAIKVIVLNNARMSISEKGMVKEFIASYAQVTSYEGTDLRVVLVGKNVDDSTTTIKYLFYDYSTFKSSRKAITFNEGKPEEVRIAIKNKELRLMISSVYKN